MKKLNSKIKDRQKEMKKKENLGDLQSADLGRVHLRVRAEVCF